MPLIDLYKRVCDVKIGFAVCFHNDISLTLLTSV